MVVEKHRCSYGFDKASDTWRVISHVSPICPIPFVWYVL